MSKFINKRDYTDRAVQPWTTADPHLPPVNSQTNPKTSRPNPDSPLPPEPSAVAAESVNPPEANPRRLKRRRKRRKEEKPLVRRVDFWVLVTFAVGAGSAFTITNREWQELNASLPESTSEILTFARENTVTITASDGTVIEEVGPVTHNSLEIDEIPEALSEAFMAIEDRRFLEHDGVDYQGVMRAAWANLTARRVVEGGSTITQQLARIVFLDQDRKFSRKLREMRIAQKIEAEYDKDTILERYLNLVYLGSGAYGIADAAWIYFGKEVEDLTLSEAATIAGIAPAPSRYSPLENREAAEKRRNLVLQRMAAQDYITATEAEEAIAFPLVTNPQEAKRFNRKVPYFTDYVQKELRRVLPPEKRQEGGLIVETTINLGWQNIATEAVEKAVERYGRYQRFEQAALVAIDPRNGRVMAMVGGKDYNDKEENGEFNRATQAQRQPGSTFKTFVYSTAIAAGLSPYQGLRDQEFVVDGYKPKNYDGEYRGWISLRDALIKSINIPALQTLIQVGWDPTIEVAKKMGIESELKPTYSLALGASEVTLLELTSAYGTLANKGLHVKPHGISRIRDRYGEVIYEAEENGKRALDEDSAAIMTWMLRGVINEGTGTAARLDRPAAGKTGTTDDARDLWFIGYIPQVVSGVWLGNDDNKPTWGASSTAAAVWREFMVQLTEWLETEEFPDRPQQLEGREATVEAKPIKPKRTKYIPNSSNNNSSGNTNSNSNRGSGNNRTSSGSSGGSSRSSRRSGGGGSPSAAPAPAPRPQPAPAPAPRQAAPAPAPAVPDFSKPKKIQPSAPPPMAAPAPAAAPAAPASSGE